MTRQSENNVSSRLLLRPQEAANALGVSLRTLMSLVASGEIPHTRIGERNLRFPLDALREWVARRTTWPTELVASADAAIPQPGVRCSCAAGSHGGDGWRENHGNRGETLDSIPNA
jgi:excisionase family DNA binding protein